MELFCSVLFFYMLKCFLQIFFVQDLYGITQRLCHLCLVVNSRRPISLDLNYLFLPNQKIREVLEVALFQQSIESFEWNPFIQLVYHPTQLVCGPAVNSTEVPRFTSSRTFSVTSGWPFHVLRRTIKATVFFLEKRFGLKTFAAWTGSLLVFGRSVGFGYQ